MKNTKALFLLIVLLTHISGCSIFYEFTIYNKSDKTITISYELTSENENAIFKKYVRTFFIKGNREDTLIHDNIYDNSTKTVMFQLRPKRYAVIGQGWNTFFDTYKNRLPSDPDKTTLKFANLKSIYFISGSDTLKSDWGMLDFIIDKKKRTETRITFNEWLM